MATKITERTENDLREEIAEKHEALRVFRFGASGGKAKNPHEGKTVRKEIARIMTELSTRAKRA